MDFVNCVVLWIAPLLERPIIIFFEKKLQMHAMCVGYVKFGCRDVTRNDSGHSVNTGGSLEDQVVELGNSTDDSSPTIKHEGGQALKVAALSGDYSIS